MCSSGDYTDPRIPSKEHWANSTVTKWLFSLLRPDTCIRPPKKEITVNSLCTPGFEFVSSQWSRRRFCQLMTKAPMQKSMWRSRKSWNLQSWRSSGARERSTLNPGLTEAALVPSSILVGLTPWAVYPHHIYTDFIPTPPSCHASELRLKPNVA